MIEWINHFGALWARYFGMAIVQNTIFLTIVILVLHNMKNNSASMRYFVGMLGLFKLLIPPFIPGPAWKTMLSLPGTFDQVFIANSRSNIEPVSPEVILSIDWTTIIFFLWFFFGFSYLMWTLFSAIRLRLSLKKSDLIEQIHFKNRLVYLYKSEKVNILNTINGNNSGFPQYTGAATVERICMTACLCGSVMTGKSIRSSGRFPVKAIFVRKKRTQIGNCIYCAYEQMKK